MKAMTLGYNTSRVAEASNSRLKRILEDRALTLPDIRLALNKGQEQFDESRTYIKWQKAGPIATATNTRFYSSLSRILVTT